LKDVFEKFKENMEKYKSIGLNPLSLATGCAVKVDLIDIVYPALNMIRKDLEAMNIEILPREDADIFVSREEMEVKRVINSGEFGADRAISLIQVNQQTASSPESFARFLLKVYSSVKTGKRLIIGKGHSIVTTKNDGEVAVLDMIKLGGRKLNSYTAANNDTIQIVDPLEEPGSQMQTDVAISNSLNDLFTKGVYKDLVLIPLVDAPERKLKERILSNFYDYSRRYNIEVKEEIQPETNTLMIGATVIGKSDHELPVYYSEVRENMYVLVTRPVGELTPVNVYLWLLALPDLLEDLERRGISLRRLEEVKRRAIDYMKKPNIEVAEAIYNRLPEFGRSFDVKNHIAMTTDVTGPGIFVIKEFAEKAGVDIELFEVPVIDNDICEFATENFIIPNSTAGTNGATIIFATRKVTEDLMQELNKKGLEPKVIGKVLKKGEGCVYAPRGILKLIHRENILKYFRVKE
jgi:selenophosphate synthase